MSSQEPQSTLRAWFVKSALEALKTREAGCWYRVLEDPENRYPDETWALVIGWLPDGEALDGYSAYAGVKTQPSNSVMRCDFDVDWQSPLCDDGSVDDTETCIEGMSEKELESAFDWLLNIAKSYRLRE
jgi:hypothetical protein